MPQWCPSVIGVIAIRASTPPGPTTPHADQDASLMATLKRLGREPVAPAGQVDVWPTGGRIASENPADNRTNPSLANHQGPSTLVRADLPRLVDQLRVEAQVIRRLLHDSKRTTPGPQKG